MGMNFQHQSLNDTWTLKHTKAEKRAGMTYMTNEIRKTKLLND